MRLLLVEDEEAIALPLKSGLERRGYAVDFAADGEKGYREAQVNSYDCILLDLNLPGMDGLQVAKQLRDKGNTTPILMLTARDLRKDVWAGFENGADDYLTKPFDFTELVYRVAAIIKRSKVNVSEKLEVSGLELDPRSIKVRKGDLEIALNRKEFGILEYLLRQKGHVVTPEELLEHVWDSTIDSFTQTVRTNMKTLRKKVDPNKKIIKTIKGYGYIIE